MVFADDGVIATAFAELRENGGKGTDVGRTVQAGAPDHCVPQRRDRFLQGAGLGKGKNTEKV